jgi:hypothetical protein
MPPAELATASEDPRIAAFANDVGRVLKMNPALGAMHPFGSTLAEECTALFTYSLRTIGIETIGFVPSYGHWLDRCDMRSTYALHKTVLQAFQHAQPTERWVLKSPNHLWCLDTLMETYPDARVVWMHRDPSEVVPSLASINNAMQISFTRKHEPVRVANYWADKLVDGIAKASAFDSSQPAGWCHHVHYDDLIADPAAAVASIYNASPHGCSIARKTRSAGTRTIRAISAGARRICSSGLAIIDSATAFAPQCRELNLKSALTRREHTIISSISSAEQSINRCGRSMAVCSFYKVKQRCRLFLS